MARAISRAEAYEKAHEVFSQINFNSFDYNTIKESLLDYVKLYFPEDFNDYIESSEFIAILEMFAYVGELLAYRVDFNAHENFISTAQRKESVLRLAKMISYKATRNLPNRGLVKMTSITTTDTIYDSAGRNLAGRKILWNDPNNSDWKEQFLLIMNRILDQEFGTVSPADRVQVDDVLFELYTLNNNPVSSNSGSVFSYGASVSGQNVPMELVPTALDDAGPYEKRPEVSSKFTLMYASDGLGDNSDTTGFLMFTKQGTLQKVQRTFDGITPNQTFDISVDNINDTDVYINNVDPDTRQIIVEDPFAEALPHLTTADLRYGEWIPVDVGNAQNIMFNTNRNRRKFEVETLADDQIRIIFGDGEFSNIPSGSFDIWYRTSINENITIPRNSISNKNGAFTYSDAAGNVQTISFTFSLVNSLQNGSASETIDHIRRVAPSVYYTQDRMVNGRDYNSFMLQDPSILKMRATNRTFAGDSKYIAWHDPKEYYEDVKIFGDDLAIFWEERTPITGGLSSVNTALTPSQIRIQTIEPLLSSSDVFSVVAPVLESFNLDPTNYRRTFTAAEASNIDIELTKAQNGAEPNVDMYYYLSNDQSTNNNDNNVTTAPIGEWLINPDTNSTNFQLAGGVMLYVFRIESVFSSGTAVGWDVRYRTRRLVAHSETTKFWNTTTTDTVINFDTLDGTTDKIVVLQANPNATGTALMSQNTAFAVLAQRLVSENLPDSGLPNQNELQISPADVNNDSVPDDMQQSEIMGTYGSPTYVYFSRESTSSAWQPQPDTAGIQSLVAADEAKVEDEKLYKKHEGRYPLNFAWMHSTQNLGLIDPAPSNIIDMFIITVGYYTDLRRYLNNRIDNAPILPTPYELKNSYSNLLESKMISDAVILHPGKFKILFGPRAISALQARIKVIRPTHTTLTDNEVKVRIVDIIRNFFDINYWEFGETFFFTELVASIHAEVGSEVDSVVIVPTSSSTQFGDLFQIQATEDEMFIPDINTTDIDIVNTFTKTNIRQ
jgi:hypothetical protein